jgi:hypothetical protein
MRSKEVMIYLKKQEWMEHNIERGEREVMGLDYCKLER